MKKANFCQTVIFFFRSTNQGPDIIKKLIKIENNKMQNTSDKRKCNHKKRTSLISSNYLKYFRQTPLRSIKRCHPDESLLKIPK